MLEEGSLFFHKRGNGDLIVRKIVELGTHNCHKICNVRVEDGYFKSEDDYHFLLYIDPENMLFAPLPNIEHPKIYKKGDEVYFFKNSYTLRYGIIENLYGNGYDVGENYHVQEISIVPFNWYIMYEKCKFGIKEWSKCALRIRTMCKDVRILISKYIWSTRNDYSWESSHKHTKPRRVHKRIKKYA